MSKKDKGQTIEEPQQQEETIDTADGNHTETLTVEEQLQEELKKEKDKFMRLFAEFENYKKRTTKERIDLFKTANEEVMVAMLPVLDDFDRANVEIEKSEDEAVKEGITLIRTKLTDILKSKGLEQIEVNSADVFDADLHEAITQIPAPSDDLKGKIVDVIEKGYKLGDKIIRYPKVVTGN